MSGRAWRKAVQLFALLLVVSVLSGCINVRGDNPTPWKGNASDDERLARNWDAGNSPRLVHTLGAPLENEAAAWPGAVSTPPLAIDIDQDGRDELVMHSKDRKVHVFDTETGRSLARLDVQYPPSWRTDQVLNAPAGGILQPGEPVTLIQTTPAAHVIAWQYDAAASTPDAMAFNKVWQVRTDSCHRNPGMDAAATIADMDGDGTMEILVQTEQIGFYVLSHDGDILWEQCWAGGNGAALAADLDGDGRLEAIFAGDAGFISVLDGMTGAPQWTFDPQAEPYNIKPASVTVVPTVAELDGKGQKEVVFAARYAPRDDPDAFDDFHMAIFAVHQNPETYKAEVLWMRQPGWANPLSYTPLVAVDVDGDGRDEIFGMDWNTIGHHPGNWEVLDASHVFRLESDGSDGWVRSVETWWSNKHILVVDVDGDGKLEVVFNAPKGDEDGLWRVDAATGRNEGFLTAHPVDAASGPVLVDTGQGRLHVALSGMLPGDEPRSVILLYDMDVGGA